MELSREDLIKEIKTLKKAAAIHTKYSIAQYKKVLKLLEELEKEKESLEKKVAERTKHLKMEIEENIRLNKKLKELANFDPLTKLLNRRAFNEKLQELKDKEFSVMFLDLDGFKQVNDIYGHKVGDELLKIVAKRIINTLRSEDIVGRLGGDEFVVLIKGDKSEKDLEIIAEKLIKKISAPIIIDNITAKVGTSIGIYKYDKKAPIKKVLSFADVAMYEAKKSGKGKYIFFKPTLNKKYIQLEIKKALQDGTLNKEVYPIYYHNELFGFEVLVNFEELSFNKIIEAINEDRELLENFTLYLLSSISEKTLIPLHYKLFDLKFLEKLKKAKISPENICIALESKDLIYIKRDILNEFHKYGFKIVLDRFERINFGLSYLEWPIDAIKIDYLNDDEKEKKIFEALLRIAEELNIKVIFKCNIKENPSFCLED